MSLLEIVLHPSEILREKSVEIKPEEILKLNKFIVDMTETMLKKDGIGLAAPQVGKNIRLIAINKEAGETQEHLVLINPRITSSSKKKCILEEGCLSVPDFFGDVERPEKIRIKAIDINGEKVQIKAKGMLARVLQHEIDHLDGILFIDKLVKNG